MQSQTRKNCLHWYKSIDHTVANELLRRVSNLLKGLIRQKKSMKVSKKPSKHRNGKFFYKRISNYIQTCSTTPNTSKFARVRGWAKKHKCSIACDHTTGRLIKTRSNNPRTKQRERGADRTQTMRSWSTWKRCLYPLGDEANENKSKKTNLRLMRSSECLTHLSKASSVLVLKYSTSSSHSLMKVSSSLPSDGSRTSLGRLLPDVSK